MSRSKRLYGVADAAPIILGRREKVANQRHMFSCSSRLSSCSWLRMYSRITASSRPTVATEVAKAYGISRAMVSKIVRQRREPPFSGLYGRRVRLPALAPLAAAV